MEVTPITPFVTDYLGPIYEHNHFLCFNISSDLDFHLKMIVAIFQSIMTVKADHIYFARLFTR